MHAKLNVARLFLPDLRFVIHYEESNTTLLMANKTRNAIKSHSELLITGCGMGEQRSVSGKVVLGSVNFTPGSGRSFMKGSC